MTRMARLVSIAAVVCSAVGPAQILSAQPGGGTISVVPASRDDASDAVSTGAAITALGARGFTILNDPAHAAYIAEVITTRTEIGTSVAKGRTGPALATGGGVNIPISRGKSVLLPMLRTEIEIRIRRRGEPTVLWHGAAVTVRSAGARDGGVSQVAYALSQAALSSYPTQTKGAISIP